MPGAARFVTAMESYSRDLCLFSGDLFSPSALGSFFKGDQIVDVFKRLNVDVTCLGNHDTDYGLKKMSELISATQGVWLMANCYVEDLV